MAFITPPPAHFNVALMGPPGAVGPPGPQGPAGPAGTGSGPPSGNPEFGIVPISSAALENSHQFKTSAGNLYAFECTNVTDGVGFIMVFNRNAVPSDGAVTPVRVYEMPANSTVVRDFDPPHVFSTGILVLFSTTGPFVKTTPAAASCFFVGDVV